ncbi:MAG: TRAP transporter substrate-binding protein [Casimicrobiaceae bacterium]
MNDRIERVVTAFLAVTVFCFWTQLAFAADTVVMNLGWETPLDSEYGILATKFKELTEKYTNGTVEVKLRCCGQVGTEDNAFKSLQLGTVDGYIISQNNVSPSWPLMDVFVLPYIFQSDKHAAKVLNGPIGEQIRTQLNKDTHVVLLTYGGVTYRDMYNSKRPINDMKDLAGLKLRVPKNAVMIATFKAFGAEPTPLAWSDTPTALQTGTIDGGDNGTAVIREMKFYEFVKYLTIIDHFVGTSPLFASDRFMKKLNPEQAKAVRRAADEAGAYQAQYQLTSTQKVRAWLVEKGGMQETHPDRKPFIAAALKVQQEVAAQRDARFRELVKEIQQAAQ